jgi:hypothetical protein
LLSQPNWQHAVLLAGAEVLHHMVNLGQGAELHTGITHSLFGMLILVVIGGLIILQLLARNIGWSFLVVDQMRGLRLVYPLAFALAAAGLESIRVETSKWLRAPAALAVGLLLLPVVSLSSVTLTRMYFPQSVSAIYLMLVGQKDQIHQQFLIPNPKPKTLAMEATAKWAQENTSPQALFLCDDSRFRLISRRSVAFAFKDGGTCYYLGKGMFMEWARRESAVRRVRNSQNLNVWIAVAQNLGCDFVVVDKTTLDSPSIAAAVYQNSIFAVTPIRTSER